MPALNRRWLLLVGLLFAGALTLAFTEKFFVTAYYRLTGKATDPSPDKAPVAAEYVFDFSGKSGKGNLAIDLENRPAKDSFFQLDSPHPLKLLNLTDHTVEVRSFGSFIDYENGQYRWLTVQIAPAAVTYPEALAVVERYVVTLGLTPAIDVKEYGLHLGPVADAETWVPVVSLPNAKVSVMLNCNWQWMAEAKTQLQSVRCRPNINFARPD